LPWIDQKGISSGDLLVLAEVLMDWDGDNANSEINGRAYAGPPDTEQALLEVPPVLVARLAELSPDECATFGASWSAKFRAEAAKIKKSFVRERELARPESEWITRLSELAKLAKVAAQPGRKMFMWMCV
jgi:hypothetical protein